MTPHNRCLVVTAAASMAMASSACQLLLGNYKLEDDSATGTAGEQNVAPDPKGSAGDASPSSPEGTGGGDAAPEAGGGGTGPTDGVAPAVTGGQGPSGSGGAGGIGADTGGSSPTGGASFDCDAVSGTRWDGHCYFATSTALDFPSARALCEEAAATAHLVTINSAQEQSTVQQAFFPATNDYWIGLSLANLGVPPARCSRFPASCPFRWATGEPVTYTNWVVYEDTGPEPDFTGACVRVRFEYDGGWGDMGCAEAYPGLCEVE
jgi:hypothetical protein